MTTDDARNPVVVDGVASRVTDPAGIAVFVAAMNSKYEAGMTTDFQDPEVNGTYVVTPERVIAISGDDFTGSPTRWRFPGSGLNRAQRTRGPKRTSTPGEKSTLSGDPSTATPAAAVRSSSSPRSEAACRGHSGCSFGQ